MLPQVVDITITESSDKPKRKSMYRKRGTGAKKEYQEDRNVAESGKKAHRGYKQKKPVVVKQEAPRGASQN